MDYDEYVDDYDDDTNKDKEADDDEFLSKVTSVAVMISI